MYKKTRILSPKVLLHLAASLAMAWVIALPSAAYASGAINVNTMDDEFGDGTNDTCSLREAVEANNIHNDFGGCMLNGTAPFTIELGAGTYTLSRTGSGEDFNKTGDLDFLAPVMINGVTAEETIIQAGSDMDSAIDRVFHILPTAEINVSNVTIQHGMPEADGNGGGIANFGGLTLTDAMVAHNRALGDEPGEGGGGIFNGPNSVATLNNSTVAMNHATAGLGNGGGIFNGPNAILTVTGGMIHDNETARAGGGIENNAGFVTLNQVALNKNYAGINGGGLHISSTGTVQMNGGEAKENLAAAEGGALWNSAVGTLTVADAMIAKNTASGGDADQGGGGLFNDGGSMKVTGSTIIGNVADGASGSGGGILATVGSTLHVGNSSIVENVSMRAGGGIEINASAEMMVTASLNNVEFARNETGAAPGNGGALHVTGPAFVTAANVTAMDNYAAAEGGGFWNSAVGTMSIVDSSFTGNSAAGNDAEQGGGALFNDGGEMTVRNTEVRNNMATGTAGSGGGIFANEGSMTHVSDGIIAGNSANRAGGGIEIRATEENVATAKIDSIEISGNTTGDAPGNGGALHITGPGEVHVEYAQINGNTAAAEGGGLWNSAVGTLHVSNVSLKNNSASGNDADQGGGALFNDGGIMNVSNVAVEDNVADGTSGSGGGLLANSGSTLSIVNSHFNNNTSNRAGGAIEIKGTAEAMTTAQLIKVNFAHNSTGSAPGNGGAIHITGQADVMIDGSHAMGNTAAAEGGAFWNSAVGTLTVKNVTLEENVASGADADQGGGALFNDGGTMMVFNAHMMNNHADGASGSGGGVLIVPGSITEITGGAINSNTANRAGGGIEVNATITDTVVLTLTGVTLKENMAGAAPGNGGALHVTGPADVTVNGGVIMGNMATAEGGGLWNSAVGTMSVDGAKIKANVASGNDADQGGGGLFNDGGMLTVANTIVRGNKADGTSGSGGGILNNMGTLSVTDSTIAGNMSNRAGGGIEDNAGVMIDLHNVRLLKNATGDAPGNGGALHITGPGTVNVVNGTVAENSAAAEGGGLWNSAVGTLTVSDTTFNKNVVSGSGDEQGGGALFNDGGILTVSNSTLTGNAASNDNGGGLLNAAGTSNVINVTVYENHGSGLANAGDALNLSNSIVAANSPDCVGSISTNGLPNLDSDGSCGVTITAAPMVGMLANNGGKTATLALMDGSPAIDAGDNGTCATAAVNNVDQRGVARPQGNACDLGAFEASGDNNGGGDNGGGDNGGGDNGGGDNGGDGNGDDGCAVVPNNIIKNGSFEDGGSSWTYFTAEVGEFDITDEATDCEKAAEVEIEVVSSNVQLYQSGLTLMEDTQYRLSFMIYSSTGSDVGVYIHDHESPYTNYGLAINQVNLSTGWQPYSVEFTTDNISGSVDNARLRFWFAPFAQGGDFYFVDDVRLEVVDGSESAFGDSAYEPMFTASGMLLGIDEATFAPSILETVAEGNSVDESGSDESDGGSESDTDPNEENSSDESNNVDGSEGLVDGSSAQETYIPLAMP